MTKVYDLGESGLSDRLQAMADDLLELAEKRGRDYLTVYAVPRAGVHVLHYLTVYTQLRPTLLPMGTPEGADVIIDDVLDSGSTRQRYEAHIDRGVPFLVLVDKPAEGITDWVQFPWDSSGEEETTVEDNVVRLLQYIGEDASREGLQETPARVAKAMREIYAGYRQDPKDVVKVFTDGADKYNEMVVVNDIPFYSACEHHMETIFGVASIAYIPDGKILGLSKLSRLLDVFARRLQVQERLTVQVADTLQELLAPKGVGVLIRARHMCMERRGVCKQGHHTVTSALRGVLREDPAARAEFMKLTDTNPKL